MDTNNSSCNLNLVIIGHIALNEDKTSHGSQTSIGGAAFYCAQGASILNPQQTGIVSSVGSDFDMRLVEQLGVDTQGINLYSQESTAHFVITQHEDGTRQFDANWGVADKVTPELFPQHFLGAKHFHLSTAPPSQQLFWIEFLRQKAVGSTISIDTFEYFARHAREQTMEAIAKTDLLFVNEEEVRILGLNCASLGIPCVLKLGRAGAIFIDGLNHFHSPATEVEAIDTTGAGDILAGCFLSLVNSGLSSERALTCAVKLATASVVNFGVMHEHLCAIKDVLRTSLSIQSISADTQAAVTD